MENQTTIKNEKKNVQNNICNECGSKMMPEGGCFTCPNCGYSPCSI